MYHTMRKIHLFSAMLMLIFVLIYSVSGYVMEFPARWLGDGAAGKEMTDAFRYAGAPNTPDCVQYVKQTYHLRGIAGNPRSDNKHHAVYFMFRSPLTDYAVKIDTAASRIQITPRPCTMAQMLERFHGISGFEGGTAYKMWCAIVDILSAATIFFALSGVYLWHKTTRHHTAGWIVLGLSIAYTAATAVYCVASR